MSGNRALMLPHGWARMEVGEAGEFINGVAFKPSDWGDSGLPIIRIQNLTDASRRPNCTERQVDSKFRVKRGDILVSWSATLDAFLWDREDALLNQHIFKVIPEERLVQRRFLYYLLRVTIAQMKHSGDLHGSTMRHINRDPFLAFHLPLPPLNEQQRIVDQIEKHLTRLDAAVAALERARANIKRHRAAVLKAACEGRLVPTEAELARTEGRDYETADVLLRRILEARRAKWEADQIAKMEAPGKRPNGGAWKAKYTEPEPPKRDTLPPVPEGWAWATLRSIAELKGGITKGQKRRSRDILRSVPYLRVANVQRGYIDLTEIKLIEALENEIEELRLMPGDMLFNEGGDRDKLGRGWVWQGQIPDCIHQNHVFRARLYGAEGQPKFISWYGNSFGQSYFLSEGKQTTNLASINLTKLGSLPVPIPPAHEQTRIVVEIERRLSVLDNLETSVDHSLKRAERLRQAILKLAFEGRLVTHDENDEPASVLLGRIRAERAAAGAVGITRRHSERSGTAAMAAAAQMRLGEAVER